MQQTNGKSYWRNWYVLVVIVLIAEIIIFTLLTEHY